MGNSVIGCEHNWIAHYSPVKSGLPNMFLCTKCGLKVDSDEYGDVPGELEIARRELEEATGRKWVLSERGNFVSPPANRSGLKPLLENKLMFDEVDQAMDFILNESPSEQPKRFEGARRFPEGGIVSGPERVLCEHEYKVLMVLAGEEIDDIAPRGAAFNVAYTSLRRNGLILRVSGKLTEKGENCVRELRERGYPARWRSPTGRLTSSRPEFAMPYGTKRQSMGKTESLANVDYSGLEERVMAHYAKTDIPYLPLPTEVEPARAITPLLLFSVMTLAAILAVAAYWPAVERWLGSAFAEALIKFSPFG